MRKYVCPAYSTETVVNDPLVGHMGTKIRVGESTIVAIARVKETEIRGTAWDIAAST